MLRPRARSARSGLVVPMEQGDGLVVSDRQNRPGGLGPDFFARYAVEVARDLIGTTLLLDGVGGTIVETEAYAEADPASHSHVGRTRRNRTMFGPPGHAYVYLSYGLHRLLNLVCASDGIGEAVLLRALVPEHGLEVMARRRPGLPIRDWCRGPGRLGLALGVGLEHDGLPLGRPPFALGERSAPCEVVATPRIGISRAVERPWRFVAAGSPWVSGPARLVRDADAAGG